MSLLLARSFQPCISYLKVVNGKSLHCLEFLSLLILQGEDVVAGIRTPEDLDAMKRCMPEAYKELVENCEILENHYKDMMVSFFFFLPYWQSIKLCILIY